MNSFFSRLSYSFGNEDWRTEKKALRLQPNDRVVCITASGDRTLHLLLDECKEVVSVDCNPIQNHLLRLKMAALKVLDYKDYLEFLGADQGSDRKKNFDSLKPHMPSETVAFWNENADMVEKGVLYQGAIEKIASRWAYFASIFRRKKIEKLFQFDDIEKQRQFVEQKWDSVLWRGLFKVLLHPSLSRLWLKDPGLYEHLDEALHPGDYIYNRMRDSLYRHLAKKNLLLSFLFFGKVGKEAFPPYLTQNGMEKMRPRLDKINVQDNNIITFLENEPSASFDAYSISDVASYITEEEFVKLLKEIYRTAKPGARFCLRQFLSSRDLPFWCRDKFCRDLALEDELAKEDQTFVYKFIAGTIK